MKIYFECSAGPHFLWETDFILNELFTDAKPVFVETSQLATYPYEPNNVLVFTSNLHTVDDIIHIATNTTFKIIVHLSDEYGTRNEFNQLGNLCTLYLRQYAHPNYSYTPNTIHIPLGYTNYGLEGSTRESNNPSARQIHSTNDERPYNWSFFGTIDGRSDRERMISAFKRLSDGRYGATMTVTEVFDYYTRSIFVPNGRGNVTLDCFRLYEATACGAIPVVVGSLDEISVTFGYENNPPWIFAPDWDAAVNTCSALLDNPAQIYERRMRLNAWWNERLETIRTRIQEFL